MKGYLNDNLKTNEKFQIFVFYPYGRVYKTGDLAKILENGEIEIIGRKRFSSCKYVDTE